MTTCFKITVDEDDSVAASAALFDKICEQDVPAARGGKLFMVHFQLLFVEASKPLSLR